mgnify:CR=1 FL=1
MGHPANNSVALSSPELLCHGLTLDTCSIQNAVHEVCDIIKKLSARNEFYEEKKKKKTGTGLLSHCGKNDNFSII